MMSLIGRDCTALNAGMWCTRNSDVTAHLIGCSHLSYRPIQFILVKVSYLNIIACCIYYRCNKVIQCSFQSEWIRSCNDCFYISMVHEVGIQSLISWIWLNTMFPWWYSKQHETLLLFPWWYRKQHETLFISVLVSCEFYSFTIDCMTTAHYLALSNICIKHESLMTPHSLITITSIPPYHMVTW